MNHIVQVVPFQDLFFSACAIFIIATTLKALCFLSFTFYSNKLSQASRRDIQNKIYTKYMDSDHQFFLDHKQGTLLYRLLNAPVNVGTVLKLVPDIFVQSVKILFLIILLFSMSPNAAFGILAVGTLFGFLVKRLSSVSYRFGKEVTQALSDQTTIANESISGIRQIKIYSNQKLWIRKFWEKINAYFYYKFRSQILNAIPIMILEPLIICAIGSIGILLRIKYGNRMAELLPMLTVYMVAILRINPSLTIIGQHRMLIMNVLPDLEMSYSALKSPTRTIHDGRVSMKSFDDKITFTDVTFTYPSRGEVFKNLSLTIRKGQTTAIAGPSGAGKSTLMDLLVRLYDPLQGTIQIDGIDLKEIRIESWREKIGYVSQDPFIFHATIAENIAFDMSRYPMAEIIAAAKIANAHDFIREFPDGYDTVVGDKGAKLSGGQKQRITIARAVVRKPELIIFDEATSSLDTISEKQVQEAIDDISEKYTVIIIAHRLSTIKNADRILILDDKRIVEEGNHKELLQQKGMYWRLHQQAVSEESSKTVTYASV
ncbi:MAG: ABC transporter ATP-binding protein [Desulfobacteraceae bacterium]|nr:MAG: ABC transporter ATP-binding protein [Desulfobacteraceae bacterium]